MRHIEKSTLTRRHVVAGLSASVVLAACSSGASPDAPPADGNRMAAQAGQALATGEMDRWAAMVGKEFTAGGFRLKLAGVQPLPSEGARPSDVTRQAAFVAVFETLSGGTMPGDLIYTLTSPTHVLDVFLASAATAQFPNRMHAVFN